MTGRAKFHNGKLVIDENGWTIVKRIAKKKHKSPKYIVVQALRRMVKLEAKNG